MEGEKDPAKEPTKESNKEGAKNWQKDQPIQCISLVSFLQVYGMFLS